MSEILLIISLALFGANIFLFCFSDSLYKKCYELKQGLINEKSDKN